MEDRFPIYVQLWRRAEQDGAWVHYDGWADHGMAGYFDARVRDGLGPMIAITRPYYIEDAEVPRRESQAPPPLPQPDIERELATLAHEYGHLHSFLGRTPRDEWERYDTIARLRSSVSDELTENMPDGLTAAEANERFRAELGARLGEEACSAIVREETLAWAIGREVLVELGVVDLSFFDERTRIGLHLHRYRLGIDDAWPEDGMPGPTE